MAKMYSAGAVLARALQASGLTQIQLARELGTTQASVSRWCSGKVAPPRAMRLALAGRFGIAADAWRPEAAPVAEAEQ